MHVCTRTRTHTRHAYTQFTYLDIARKKDELCPYVVYKACHINKLNNDYQIIYIISGTLPHLKSLQEKYTSIPSIYIYINIYIYILEDTTG